MTLEVHQFTPFIAKVLSHHRQQSVSDSLSSLQALYIEVGIAGYQIISQKGKIHVFTQVYTMFPSHCQEDLAYQSTIRAILHKYSMMLILSVDSMVSTRLHKPLQIFDQIHTSGYVVYARAVSLQERYRILIAFTHKNDCYRYAGSV